MIPDLDIYRTANILVKQHGHDAQIQAAMSQPHGGCPNFRSRRSSGRTGNVARTAACSQLQTSLCRWMAAVPWIKRELLVHVIQHIFLP